MSTDRHTWIGRCFSLTLALSLSCLVLGDGKFFGAKAADPKTPFQRGLVAFENGVETLIVESTVNSPPGDYAWVIPIPSRAISIEPISAGALETAVNLMSPRVKNPPSSFFVIAALVWLSVLFCTYRAFSGRYRIGKYLSELGLLLVGLGAAVLFFSPVYAGPSSSRLSRPIKGFGHIGSYDVTEVGGGESASVIAQLEGLGVEVMSDAKAVVGDYVKEEWSFVVARLRKDKSGLAAPHPLKVRFATRTAVYPMRLTSVGANDLLLQLIVIGPTSATVGLPMEVWRTTRASERSDSRSVKGLDPPDRTFKPIGHPDIVSSVKEGSWITYLNGRLEAEKLDGDIEIGWTEAREREKTLYPRSGAFWIGANTFLITWTLFILGGTVVGIARGKKWEWLLQGPLALGLAASLLFAWDLSRAVKTVDTEPHSRLAERTAIRALLSRAGSFKWSGKRDLDVELSTHLGPHAPEKDVPGGYKLEKSGEGSILIVYDEWGAAWKRRIP